MPFASDFRSSRLLLTFALIASTCLIWASPVQAQSEPVQVRPYSVDYSAFPNICLQIAPLGETGTILDQQAIASFQIYENGESRQPVSVKREYVGNQIAIVFDAPGSFALPGSTGANRLFDDAITALDELLLSKGKWLQQNPQVDHMLLIAPTGRDTFEIATPWTVEPIEIRNSAYVLDLVSTDTPLYKMLIEAMVRMKDLPDHEQLAKFLLVFSDGIDRTSVSDVTDVINRANDLGIKILTVKIGELGTGKTLQRLAEETPREMLAEWAYADYKGVDSLAPLYSAIRSQAEQYQICYRSKISQSGPQSIEVGVMVGNREYKSVAGSVAIPVQPASVRIAIPANGTVYDRIASSWDQDPATIEPREQPVTVEVAWPDNFPRNIDRVFYEIDGVSIVADLSPYELFTWDFSRLPAGSHSLRVIVRDELGIDGKSNPVQVMINISIPTRPQMPVPSSTPIPQQIVANAREQPMLVIALAIAIAAAALALYTLIRLLRSRTAMEAMTTTVTHAVRDATEIFRPKRGGVTLGRTLLIPIIDDAGTCGEPIPIRWQTTLIGRDPARAQIVFADISVSRLHSRIVEEADHVFFLHDEGSSSGTFVNETQVDVAQPRELKSGDALQFGRVRAIFQLAGASDLQMAEPGASEDITEPLVRRR